MYKGRRKYFFAESVAPAAVPPKASAFVESRITRFDVERIRVIIFDSKRFERKAMASSLVPDKIDSMSEGALSDQ